MLAIVWRISSPYIIMPRTSCTSLLSIVFLAKDAKWIKDTSVAIELHMNGLRGLSYLFTILRNQNSKIATPYYDNQYLQYREDARSYPDHEEYSTYSSFR